MKKLILSPYFVVVFIFGLIFSGCDSNSTNSNSGEEELGIRFKTETLTSNTAKQKQANGNITTSEDDTLFISGSNGTLRITDIQFVVSEFTLEPEEANGDSTQFEDFETDPFLVDLPLNNGSVVLGKKPVPNGFYVELEFEVENLKLDDDDETGPLMALRDEIDLIYPDWPEEASMVITGDFIASEGDTTAFKVFADAEIEVEREFEPALEINEDNRTQMLTIPIIPAAWFLNSDGSVRNLSEFDWETNNELLEFEVEFEDGFSEIEFDDYDED